jgi:hypothetical protein
MLNGHIELQQFTNHPELTKCNFLFVWNFFLTKTLIYFKYTKRCRSQWPRVLRHELSSLARTLGPWVRIPLDAWMSVCIYFMFVPPCVQVAALRRADPPTKESYRLCERLRNLESGQGPTEDCGTIYIHIYI